MPQFDLFIWISLSFWTILSFHIIYYLLLFFILAPFSIFQKTLIKLYILINKKNINSQFNFFNAIDSFVNNFTFAYKKY